MWGIFGWGIWRGSRGVIRILIPDRERSVLGRRANLLGLLIGPERQVQDLALEQSSFLNKAYSTLFDPLSRAQYLVSTLQSPPDLWAESSQLEIHGNPIAETDSLDDPALLMDVMEAREELEEAQTEEEVEKVKASNAGHIQEAMRGLAEAFGCEPPDLVRAKALAIEMQYLQNLERAAREWQPGKRVEVVH
jgi:molecular chaperone HscB